VKDDGWLDHDLDECQWYQSVYTADADVEPSNNYPCQEDENLGNHTNISTLGGGKHYHLWQWDNDVNGSLPPELFALLPSLQTLDLGQKALVGPLPTEIGLLTNLTSLYLNDNSLTGQIQ